MMQQLSWIVDFLRSLFAPLSSSVMTIVPDYVIGSLPALILVVFAFIALVIGMRTSPLPVSILGLLGALMSVILFDSPTSTFGTLFRRDALSDFFIYIILIVGLIVLLSSTTYKGEMGPYNFLFLISVAGAIWVVMASDLVSLFVAWELMSTPTYILVALGPRHGAVDGATKYFIMGLLSTTLLLFGIALVYGITGTTEISAVAQSVTLLWQNGPVNAVYTIILALVLFVTAFGFKIGLFPGWMWVPDAYSTADGNVTAYLAGATKKAGIGAVIRLLMVGFVIARFEWTGLVIVVSVLTMIIGNYLALAEKNLMRMLAYSSIAMMGYLLMGIAAGTEYGAAAAIFHAFVHALMKTGAFVLVWALSVTLAKDVTYNDLAGLGRRVPAFSALFAILIMSLAGVPFTAGFWSKIWLFASAFFAGYWWFALIGVFNVVYALGYYLPVLKMLYFAKSTDETPLTLPRGPVFAALLCVIPLILIMVNFGLVFDYANVAASELGPWTP